VGFLDRLRTSNPFRDPGELDKISLGELEKAGADLALPRHLLHFMYFGEEADAIRACDEISRTGWDTTLTAADESTPRWLVRADATRVVDANTVRSYRAWFEDIAATCNGEYDGWEAAAKP
jgi:hypothetical protein